MRTYKNLSTSVFQFENFELIPIRDEDKFEIMQSRNEQIYHLRQSQPLTIEQQEHYFSTVVSKLFEQEQPNQLLFSFLENGNFIGYGGLVHINWIDKIAEISFVMKTELEKNRFEEIWLKYLLLIEEIAFEELNFYKLFTYAFDLRPHLYPVLEKANFTLEARLKSHVLFDGKRKDVLIHSKFNLKNINFREVTKEDKLLLLDWVNEASVVENSINQRIITFSEHSEWFEKLLLDENKKLYIFEQNDTPIGQVRLDYNNLKNEALITFSVSKDFRGKNIGYKMLDLIIRSQPDLTFTAVVRNTNQASLRIFEKLGFQLINKNKDFNHLCFRK